MADSKPQGGKEKWQAQWNSESHGSEEYGKLFFDRATGEAQEMESSKAAARRVAGFLKEGETLVDVGCGAGHYLRSLRREVPHAFRYRGLDATARYVELARQAFASDTAAEFSVADIFGLDVPDAVGDVTLCANVLLHLPTVAKPLSELVRVTRRRLLVRTLVSDASYVVKRVTPAADGSDFDAQGEPMTFHFLNIYSQAYIHRVLQDQPRVASVKFELDRDFDAERLADSKALLHTAKWNATEVVAGMQRSGMLLMPWTWIDVELRP